MKIITWNVNGIRACIKHGLHDWMNKEKPDLFCLQETKIPIESLTNEISNPLGYESVFVSAEKKGYSGVAIYYKQKPKKIIAGLGDTTIDREGRVLSFEYPNYYLINAYFPNSQPNKARLDFKIYFGEKMLKHCNDLVKNGKNIILTGDYNIAPEEIDLARPKENMNAPGFLPEERAWMKDFLNSGYVDVFRSRNQDPGHYTWWSYRANARKRNVGWRIDHFCVNSTFNSHIKTVKIHNEVLGSDHCPVEIQL